MLPRHADRGRKALVTGGASGIGAAIAARLAAEGAEVWVGDIDMPRRGEGRGRDQRPRGRARRHRSRRRAGGGRGDRGSTILVNNAGMDEFGFFPTTTPEQWQRVIDINLGGVLNCTAAALPAMQAAGYGRIVSISTEAGRVGSKGSAVYSAAKAGVIGFTKVIARENGRYGVTANAIAPGPIETPLLMGAKALGEVGERLIENMRSQTQLGRLGQPLRWPPRRRLPRLRRRDLRDRRDARRQRRPRHGLETRTTRTSYEHTFVFW